MASASDSKAVTGAANLTAHGSLTATPRTLTDQERHEELVLLLAVL